MNRFKDSLAQSPQWHAALAGVMVALLCAAILVVALGADQLRRIGATQRSLAYKVQGVSNDAINLLRRLTHTHSGDCADAGLRQLRQEVFFSNYQVDIGVLDAQQRVLCTTVLGRLPSPVRLPDPDAVVATSEGEVYDVRFHVPVLAGEWRTESMVIRMGQFSTMVQPSALDDMFGVQEGSLLIRGADGSLRVAHADPTLEPARAQRLRQGRWLEGDAHAYSWGDGAFVSSRTIAGTPYISQFVVPLSEFLDEYTTSLLVGLFLSLGAGGLVHVAVLPALRRRGMLEHRIASLLREENVLCLYQPIVDMRDGAPVGCEVLMRLRDGGQILSPDRVLPLVVQQDLCWTLDRAVVRQAVRELCAHLPVSGTLKVSFNFFPADIRCAALHELMQGALPDAPHPDLRFNIEVIEQGDQSGVAREISGLKQAGYLISIDDFGTGYSNLGSVRALAPDFIKIDKSFVFEMEDASVRSSLIPEIVAIARVVGAKVIAEGIENEAQRQRLLSFGVDHGQGYLFARPMPIADFVAFLQAADLRDAAHSERS